MRFSIPTIAALAATFAATGLTALPLAAAAQSDTAANWHGTGPIIPVDAATENVYGKPVADFSLIVWLDPECPYCKVLGKTPEMVVDGSGGRVNLVVRMMPLPMHGRAAFIAAATTLCVGQQASSAGFYRFIDRYMELTETNGAGLPVKPGISVEALAREAGATDAAKLDACVHAPETVRRLGAEFDAAQQAGVGGTPAIVVRDNRNGTTAMTEGAISGDEITRVIRALGATAAN